MIAIKGGNLEYLNEEIEYMKQRLEKDTLQLNSLRAERDKLEMLILSQKPKKNLTTVERLKLLFNRKLLKRQSWGID